MRLSVLSVLVVSWFWAGGCSLEHRRYTASIDAAVADAMVDARVCDAAACTECPAADPPSESTSCPSTRPICSADGSCRECDAHPECGSGACSLDDGTCVDPDSIAYVDATASATNSACTVADPCRTFALGLAAGKDIVVVAPGNYTEDVVITNRDVSFVAYSATLVAASNGVPAMDISVGDNVVSIWGLTITTSPAGIRCDTTNGAVSLGLRLFDATISETSQSSAIAVDQCNLTVHRSRIIDNEFGIDIYRSGFDITNSVIAGNGNGTDFGGVTITNPRSSPAILSFNTIVNNNASGSFAGGIHCQSVSSALPGFHSNIVTDNAGGSQVSQITNVSYEYSLVNPGIGGTGNITGSPFFVDADYHIRSDSAARDEGKPDTGIVDDIDGDPRPTDLPDIGADEYTPP